MTAHETLANLATTLLSTRLDMPTESMVRETVQGIATSMAPIVSSTPEDVEKAIASLLTRLQVTMDTGFSVNVPHAPWYDAAQSKIAPYYWKRLDDEMSLRLPLASKRAIDRATHQIMDLLGDPFEQGSWKRRGLIMGDVQSGKTSTYSALICKAADAGYRVIILLAGTIEELRKQTQERLDETFVGRESGNLHETNRPFIGVGKRDHQRVPVVLTGAASDFSTNVANVRGVNFAHWTEPALFVVKKNRAILDNLQGWLKTAGGHDLPLLVIDDEADNASVNTAAADDPTSVNAAIRAILAHFRRSTYVGVTATPFANIFIDPDTEHEMLSDDLFPRDFIYTLDPPSNYRGMGTYFGEPDPPPRQLVELTDLDPILPTRHKKDTAITALPQSLCEALEAFLVANAIRDLQGERAAHRSMLVNISHFTNTQIQLENLLHDELGTLKEAVRNYAGLPPGDALRNTHMKRLHDTWRRQYADSVPIAWGEIQHALHEAIQPIQCLSINQQSERNRLAYRKHAKDGMRVVVVGGNSLSRGLTLEGLMTSYFRRNTKMYDALLQMGRWFGYRDGYHDLVRIWMPREARDWFGHISDAVDELRADLRRMQRAGLTPRDFGLAVRAHPTASLIVTSRVKMRSAKQVRRMVSLSQQAQETTLLDLSSAVVQNNHESIVSFLASLGEPRSQAPLLWQDVPKDRVSQMLRSFKAPKGYQWQDDVILSLLADEDDAELGMWDVSLPSGEGDAVRLAGYMTHAEVRPLVKDGESIYAVSGNKRRVASRGAEGAGLTAAQREAAVAAAAIERKNVSDFHYRRQRKRPLLIVHALEPNAATRTPETNVAPIIALSLSFPRLEPDRPRESVFYLNIQKQREEGEIWDTEDEEDIA